MVIAGVLCSTYYAHTVQYFLTQHLLLACMLYPFEDKKFLLNSPSMLLMSYIKKCVFHILDVIWF